MPRMPENGHMAAFSAFWKASAEAENENGTCFGRDVWQNLITEVKNYDDIEKTKEYWKMKKFLALFLVLIMALSCALVACSKDKDKTDSGESDDEDEIGIIVDFYSK